MELRGGARRSTRMATVQLSAAASRKKLPIRVRRALQSIAQGPISTATPASAIPVATQRRAGIGSRSTRRDSGTTKMVVVLDRIGGAPGRHPGKRQVCEGEEGAELERAHRDHCRPVAVPRQPQPPARGQHRGGDQAGEHGATLGEPQRAGAEVDGELGQRPAAAEEHDGEQQGREAASRHVRRSLRHGSGVSVLAGRGLLIVKAA